MPSAATFSELELRVFMRRFDYGSSGGYFWRFCGIYWYVYMGLILRFLMDSGANVYCEFFFVEFLSRR